ncbi:hypothetical protein [Nonomuraea sp. NPDC049784]|uniref:hypothetical protein n=1 Tax=Nonomuraea sp. NPDC049784 TaxID=3154361 RepID=UPI0033E23D68
MTEEYNFPPALVAAQRTFYIQQEVIKRLAALEPRPTLIAAGKATVPQELRDAMSAARATQGAAVNALYDTTDEFWEKVKTGRAQAKAALEKLVKAQLDAAALKQAVEDEMDWESLGKVASAELGEDAST